MLEFMEYPIRIIWAILSIEFPMNADGSIVFAPWQFITFLIILAVFIRNLNPSQGNGNNSAQMKPQRRLNK
jgi:hypothetical protein